MRIIKAADMEGCIGVQELVLAGQPKRVAPVVVHDPLQNELEALGETVERLSVLLAEKEAELASQRAATATLREEAFASGRGAGRAEAETMEQARLKALEAGLAQACATAATQLEAIEPLALLIAREGLEKVLGDPGAYPTLIEQIVRRQLSLLKDRSVLAVEVSAEDFPNREAISRIAAASSPAVAVEIKDQLASGDCRLRLKLGVIDIGIRRQWGALANLLGDLAQEGGSA